MVVPGGHSPLPWILLGLLLAVCLAIDFGLASGRHRAIGFKESIAWNAFWIAVALAFTGVVLWAYGRVSAAEYLTGYVVERALSVDNLFVFVVIFKYFGVAAERQARVLFWGILGALVMRAAFILAGAALATRFHALLYVFGAFLVYTGIALSLKRGDDAPHPERNVVVRLVAKVLPIDPEERRDRLVTRKDGRLHGTPLLVVLLVVATTDFVFALDSLPAILGITQDAWILFASNAFAILGMRVLYFLVASLLPKFRFLDFGLSAILVFIGARMLMDRFVHLTTELTLGVVVAVLLGSIVSSLVFPGDENGGRRPD